MDTKRDTKRDTKMDTKQKIYKIGTRGSALALWQAREVAAQLEKIGVKTEEVIIKTTGDKRLDIPLQGQAETGFFTKEIENRLLAGEVDIAVHSLKDLPTKSHEDLELAAYLTREKVNDLLLIHPNWLDETAMIPVKDNCKIGATSLRRQALVRLYGPHAEPTMLRGNVPTRVDKCKDEQYGAIVLAEAGVKRLGLDLTPLTVYRLNNKVWLPAPGQGAVAVQARRTDSDLIKILDKLDHKPTREAITTERLLLSNFEGGCHTAFGSYAWTENGKHNVLLGLDQGENKGWGQVQLPTINPSEIAGITPETLKGFAPLRLKSQDELCEKILG